MTKLGEDGIIEERKKEQDRGNSGESLLLFLSITQIRTYKRL